MPKPLLNVRRLDSVEYEQIVFAELLVPETVNVYGDYWTKESVKHAAYLFMREGYGIDINHDNVDVSDSVYVAESFIARAGDPDFIEGSWVIGLKIDNADIWQKVLDNELNGFSYEALVAFLDGVLTIEDSGIRTGSTEAALDGHTHTYMVTVDEDNRPVSGGTSQVEGHQHSISTHTVTDESAGHTHRYTIVQGTGGF